MKIVIFLLSIVVIILILKLYIMLGVKKIQKRFRNNQWDGLPSLVEYYQKTALVFTKGTINKGTRALYNSMCFVGASMALVEGDEKEFVRQLGLIEKEEEYELKPFILALYYRSLQKQEEAMECYQKFLKCKPQSQDVKLIMDRLFATGEQKMFAYVDALEGFKNPAILKLFEKNNMI